MPRVIAGIYELQNQIGAGGGGIVYLGRHLRLEKQVVLKADKRTLNTGTEALRREVDMLKELSHTYIPQVYDFVQEDGVVYTVMDFIEGESLDKLLGRGQRPTQPQVIKWACQLLEALSYLHSRPPHGILHGDIKPANIMLRPNGDICLIDFNIALALGEDGAVKVGYSRGYASPEHYGADYVNRNRAAAVGSISKQIGHKKDLDDEKTVCDTGNAKSPVRSTTGGQRAIMLDVRSDIYSLGATLYHLLSGHRPAEDASEVKPLTTDVCSQEVANIIQKAMASEPEMRYQSADEMLTAFLKLHKRDGRVIRHKRRIAISMAMLLLVFCIGAGCSFVGLKQLELLQTALKLAEYSANDLAEGNVTGAVEQALQAIPTGESILEAPVTAEAQMALTNALGVYDLSDGFKALGTLELPSTPFDMVMSPEGLRLAVVYAYEVAVFDLETQQEIATLPAQNSALSDVLFVDETHIVYAGDQGITAYDMEKQEMIWTDVTATSLTISADHSIVAAVNRDEDHATVYSVVDGSRLADLSFDGMHMAVASNDTFADPEDNIFALNEDGSMLAVSFYNGGLTIFDLNHPEENLIVYDESDYLHFEGGFYGKYFAFAAEKSGEAVFGLIDTEEGIYLGGYDSQDNFLLQADEQGICLANRNLLVRVDPDNLEEQELAYTNSENIISFSVGNEYALIATDDHGFAFYDSGANLASSEIGSENSDFVKISEKYAVLGNRNEPTLRILKLESHAESQLLKYDARYGHDEARVSQDGQNIMLFSCEGFCIFRTDGTLLTQVELPEADEVYDQQFVRSMEGSWLEVIWYDGTIRCYSATDGSVISEEAGEAPSKDLYEEFVTDDYRITSSLHEAPEVYELTSGKLVGLLEEDAYLTYVTQVGEYLITEYINTEGERYGILLDEKLQKLAYLPDLCDVIGDTLVFDYESGNLRQCRLYSLQELTTLGESYRNNNK